jgi:murein DD-endopeptidase MepM/ murein hydrolase activator NlpD
MARFHRGAIALAAAAAVVFGPAPSYAATSTATGTVNSGGGLKVRTAPASSAPKVGTLGNRTKLTIICQVHGERISGRVRRTDLWDRIGTDRYVSDAYVNRGKAAIAICPAPPPPPASSNVVVAGPWTQPVPAYVSGGFHTPQRPEHDGVDIAIARNTPIHAASAGTVVTVKCNTSGTTCDVDGSLDLKGCGWYVEIQHVDSVITRYCHMIRQPEVIVGQKVTAGQVIGYVGTSGSSSGPHLHFEVHIGPAPARHETAVDPVPFMATHGAPITQPT